MFQEEENVLAQEVVLDELLRSEDLHKHWPLWTEGHQLDPVSLSPPGLTHATICYYSNSLAQSISQTHILIVTHTLPVQLRMQLFIMESFLFNRGVDDRIIFCCSSCPNLP